MVINLQYPQDIKFAMRACILKIIWPKDDIVALFTNNGCTPSDLKNLGNHKVLSRSSIIDTVFKTLSDRNDNGLGQFRALMKTLTEWTHFDPYYFETLGKLNKNEALMAISHLKQLQIIWDENIKKTRNERERRAKAQQAPSKTILSLKEEFLKLFQEGETRQNRGYALEIILGELAKNSFLEVTDSFKTNGEQIDGAIKYDGEHYLVEAKWQDKEASNEPVYQFAGKIEGKMYGRGIFVSINGFSNHVISSLTFGKHIKTIFIDGADITLVLEGLLDFRTMLDHKIKAAQTRGHIYVDPTNGKPK